MRFPFLLSFDRVKWKEENDFSVRATSVNVYQGETVHCGQRLKGGGTQKKVPRVLLPMKSSYLVTKDGNTRKAAKRGTRERENKTERKEKKRKEKKRQAWR